MKFVDYNEAKAIIEEKLGFKPSNYGPRTCWTPRGESEPVVGLFIDDCTVGVDCYFLACFKYWGDRKQYQLYGDKVTIYKVSKSLLDNYQTTSRISERENKKTQYWYKLSQCLKVYDSSNNGESLNAPPPMEYEQDVDLQGDDLLQNRLTMRDRACIDLLVPKSGKQWLNSLIKSSPIYKNYVINLTQKF